MRITLEKIAIDNFKGCKHREIEFGVTTEIRGSNASGKTTIIDAFMWTLFDKNSLGETKFQIRTLDEAGNPINGTDISVQLFLSVDGKPVMLKKVQKQNYVKNRSTQQQEFKGNVNSFEINGYPKSEKEYKDYISSLIDEELFKMITNPYNFATMPWKKQRDILFKLVSEVSDLEIAQSSEEFASLITELEIASIDDIQKKYTKAMNEWKKKQVELPARIDEVTKSIQSVDTAELELQKNALKEQIADAEKCFDDTDKAVADYQKKTDEIMKLQFTLTDIKKKANEKLNDEKMSIQKEIDKATDQFNEARNKIRSCEYEMQDVSRQIDTHEQAKKQLQEEWKSQKAINPAEYKELKPISEDDLTCPTCGQQLPDDIRVSKVANFELRNKNHKEEYEAYLKDFEKSKAETIASITKYGNECVSKIKELTAEKERFLSLIEKCKEDEIKYNKVKGELFMKLQSMPESVDLSSNEEYISLKKKLETMENDLKSMNSNADYRTQIKYKLEGLREELSTVEKEIAKADTSAAEERRDELQKELKEVSQKIADQERQLFILEKFIQAKMDRISQSINAKFKVVSWKLFSKNINGSIDQTCECTVNGVPFGSLNSGHKIIAGLDIIATLTEMYDSYAPIFTDNAESINSFNVPKMDTQLILLKVADNTELEVQ